MITNAERKKMKKVFKNAYSKGVIAILNANGVVSKKGEPYKESFVNHVFNGRYANESIEAALLELYQKRVSDISKKTIKKREILEMKLK